MSDRARCTGRELPAARQRKICAGVQPQPQRPRLPVWRGGVGWPEWTRSASAPQRPQKRRKSPGHNLTRRARKQGYGPTTGSTHQWKRCRHTATRHQWPQERRKQRTHEITYQKTKRRTRPPEPSHGNKEKPRHNGQGKEEPRKPSGLRGLCYQANQSP